MANLINIPYFATDELNEPNYDRFPWGTAVGYWGDVIVDLGLFKTRIGKGNLILCTLEKDLVEFCESQSFIKMVKWAKFKNAEENNRVYNELSNSMRPYPDMPLKRLTAKAGLPPDTNVIRTHWDYEYIESQRMDRWSGPTIPVKYHLEAANLVKDIKGRFIVINPYSLNTSLLSDHWNNWDILLHALVPFHNFTYVIVGKGWDLNLPDHPRIVNLVNKTRSNMTVFALSDLAYGTITTINSLAHYNKVANNNQFVMNNKPAYQGGNLFGRFVDLGETPYVEYNTDIATTMKRVLKWMA